VKDVERLLETLDGVVPKIWGIRSGLNVSLGRFHGDLWMIGKGWETVVTWRGIEWWTFGEGSMIF
jgi:hypothetical protein